MRASTIHEYYQLPLLLFSSPLIGLGWQIWYEQRPRWQPRLTLSLALAVSLTVLSLDYWAVEHRQREAWMPLALTIRRDLPSDARIVSVTSTDPTLLNLARRQGWLISSKHLTPEQLQHWKRMLEQAIWPAALCGTRPTDRCRNSGNNSCRRWWRQAPVPGWTRAARPT